LDKGVAAMFGELRRFGARVEASPASAYLIGGFRFAETGLDPRRRGAILSS
jgi:hypothetical protein